MKHDIYEMDHDECPRRESPEVSECYACHACGCHDDERPGGAKS